MSKQLQTAPIVCIIRKVFHKFASISMRNSLGRGGGPDKVYAVIINIKIFCGQFMKLWNNESFKCNTISHDVVRAVLVLQKYDWNGDWEFQNFVRCANLIPNWRKQNYTYGCEHDTMKFVHLNENCYLSLESVKTISRFHDNGYIIQREYQTESRNQNPETAFDILP